jgi:hypothetical protein
MARVKNFPGGLSPVWTFGPTKYYGPVRYQVVKLHDNNPPSSQCLLKYEPGEPGNGKPQGTCWVVVQGWTPLPR